MENILIVDAWSSGQNFIEDVIKRGFYPVVLWTHRNDYIFDAMAEIRGHIETHYRGKADFFVESADYAETLAKVKSYAPKIILTGADLGVELATHLMEDMEFPGNGTDRIPFMTNKLMMQKALINAGLRGIRSKVIHNWEEALAFYRSEKLTGCVMKPYRGAGSVMIRICDNEEELKSAFDEVFESGNYMGENEEGMLLQERICGTEYIVNTLSYDGIHKLTGLWRSNKKKVPGGGMVYNFMESLDRPQSGCYALVNYAFGVIDALGIRYGNVHGEFMVDEKGPVLIEVNCRPMGVLPIKFGDSVWGHHETDLTLDAYLNPKDFKTHAKDLYRPLGKGIVKALIVPADKEIASSPVLPIARRLPSFCQAFLGKALDDRLERTVDLNTSAGEIFLVNEDETQLMQDVALLERIEDLYFDMLFTGKKDKASAPPADMQSIAEVLQERKPVGSVLLCSNDIKSMPGVMTVSTDELSKTSGGFTCGILDLSFREGEDPESMADLFFLLTEKVKKGGWVLIPERTYWHYTFGSESIEILAEVKGLFAEPPPISGKVLAINIK